MRSLKSRTTYIYIYMYIYIYIYIYIYVATSVTNFGAILFTPIMHSGEFAWRSGPPCVAAVAPPWPLKPTNEPGFVSQLIQTAHLSQLTNTVPDTARLVYGLNKRWERLEYQYRAMKQAGTVDQKVFSGVLYRILSEEYRTQKSEISTKIDVYRYSRSHWRALVELRHYVGVVGQ